MIALFLCAIFLLGSIAPTASAITASDQRSDPVKPKAPHSASKVDTTTPMKTDYASALQSGDSGIKLDADASRFSTKTTPQDEPLVGKTTNGPGTKQKDKREEIVDKRTANSETFDLGNGKFETRNYMGRVHYKADGKWQKIDNTLIEDTNAADSTNAFGEALAWVKGKTQKLHTYKLTANDWQARFAASNDSVGMVRIESGGKKLAITPKDANEVVPAITTKNGRQTVTYKELWAGVDVIYTVKGDLLKEDIVLKSADSQTNFAFEITGANLKANKDGGFDIEGTAQVLSALSVSTRLGGPTSENVISQDYKNSTISIKLDSDWLKKQPAAEFPIVIDPTWSGTPGYGYTAYKSDNYVCNSSTCFMNAGTVSNNGWKYWRTVFGENLNPLNGKQLMNAYMYLEQADRSYLIGTNTGRNFRISHANCWGFNCRDDNTGASVYMNFNSYVDLTGLVQGRMNANDWNTSFMISGEETGATTWKGFDPDISFFAYEYNSVPPVPQIVTPQPDQTFIDPQVGFKVNPVVDGDGNAVLYRFRISTGSDGESGTVIDSGDINSSQWTVPDGVLQDGTTYYLSAFSYDGHTYSARSGPNKFRIDSRRGKDKTQTYDTVGPVSIDLTNGNVSTGASSHDTTALGGSLGISLDYNSPVRSRQGLVGQYWNNPDRSGSPVVTRVDQTIDFDWSYGSPSGSITNSDYFSARWDGYFVAPTTGTYYFGGTNDDSMSIYLDNSSTATYTSNICPGMVCYGNTVSLTEGQVLPIRVDYAEVYAGAYAKLYVKGAVAEQVVKQEWLQTGARAIGQARGLTGSYYKNSTGYNLDAPNKELLVKRIDSALSFGWGSGGPVPGATTDFMARWSGYIQLDAGDYVFGTNADDGAKIKINNTTVVDNYSNGCCTEKYGSSVHFNAGIYPIMIDYYDLGGGAGFTAYVKANGATTGQIIPSAWLMPSAQVLPAGWQLGLDPDGNLSYDRLSATTNVVTLSDSTGDTHTYNWTGSGYSPPVNEDGQLTHASDGRYSLADSDGRIYIFKADGTLESVTSPTDDRNPAALQYAYEAPEGMPTRVVQITDGVDSNRNAKIYYSGDNKGMCAARPNTSYIDPADSAITGYICAVRTNDGRVTSFFYSRFGASNTVQLSLIVKPGNERTSYQYDGNGTLTAVRDTLAEDAIAAGVRTADNTVLTQISYDTYLGRASGVTAPAATAGAARAQQTIEYGPINTMGSYTKQHIVGDSEPNGFTRKVTYDSILRTTTDTDVTGKTTTQQWDTYKDLLYSTTDALGLKSTTIYDTNDRPTDSYGPAPTAWFGTDNKPLGTYASQVPRTSTGYDEGITGPAVAYMNVSVPSSTNVLANNATMYRGQSIVSQDERFSFVYQTDGNLVLYGPGGTMWNSNTANQASTNLTMQTDGNLVLYNNSTPVWATGTGTGSATLLVMQNDGNLLLWTGTSAPWMTNTGGWPAATSSTASLTGAPLLHSTNPIGSLSTEVNSYYATGSPVPGKTTNWGMRMTGKMRLPTTGNWNFRIWSDNGVRMTIDDQVVINDWTDGGERNHPTYTFNETTANKPHRFTIDYYHKTGLANFTLYMTPPGGSETRNVAQYFAPDYGLVTSSTVYDSTLGNTTSTTSYGANPELGLAQSQTVNPGGLGLTSTKTYEAAGATGSYLRPTSSTLPGGVTTSYAYYAATQTKDNPCTTGTTEAYRQGGMLRLKTEPDPDGTGLQTSRTTETIYDDAGKVVATRYNSESWTCTTYDGRERVITTVIPSFGSQAGRTITNSYAIGGNPLSVSSGDGSRTIVTTTDLLGRTTAYTDAYGDQTTSTYDSHGNLAGRSGPMGAEVYVYDNYNRLVDQKLDGITYAHVVYDQYSRIDHVDYPDAGQAKLTFARDTLGRESGRSYDGTSASVPASNNVLAISNGTATASIASAAGANYDGTPHTPTTFTMTGLTATYDSTKSTQFNEYVDAGTGVGIGTQTRISYDFTGDGTWDRTETYNYFATDPVTGYEQYNQTKGIQSSTGTFANLENGKVKVEVWNAIGNGASTLNTPTSTIATNASTLTIPYTASGGSSGGTAIAIASDTVTRSQSGQILTDIVASGSNELWYNYGYDAAGRLTSTNVGPHTYSYGFGAQNTATCGTGGDTNPNSGKNSNRTSQTVNGVTTYYCYDYADRLTSSSNTAASGTLYDTRGNMTQIGTGSSPMYLGYDSSDRNWGFDQYTSSGNGKGMYYDRDVQGRIIARYSNNITNWNWTDTGSWYYGFTGSGDTPDYARDGDWSITEKHLQLPGGVIATIKPKTQQQIDRVQYSLPNIHGDTLLTLNGVGGNVSTGNGPANAFTYDPFGNALPGSTLPANEYMGSYGWVGSHEKLTESNFTLTPMQMGVRVYLPTLGRFAQVDPVEGGTPNAYVYGGDPVNGFDLTGEVYTNYGASYCYGVCVALNVMKDGSNGQWYYSAGGGVGTPGAGVSITYGGGHPSSGWSAGGSAGYIVGGSYSYDGKRSSWEGGSMSPGASVGAQYTARLTKCTFGIGKCGAVAPPKYKAKTKFSQNLKNSKLQSSYYKKLQKKR